MPLREKPTPYYHMEVCRLAEQGWRKTKNGIFHGEPGTFLSKGDSIVFVGWSGKQVFVCA